jgi:quinol monooxygenase YgiN
MRTFHRFALVALAFLLLSMSVPVRAADEKTDPIIANVKANLKDTSKPFTMLVLLKVKAGNEEKFEKAFSKAVEPTRKEKGCKAYDLAREAKAAGQYVVYERWADLAALDAHIKSKHIQTLLGEIGELLASPPEVKVYVPAAE